MENEESFFQNQRARKIQAEEFRFPPSDILNERFETFTQVFAFILQLEGNDPLHKNLFKKKRRGNYLYLKCRLCSSSISLRETDRVVFIRFSNSHRHSNMKSKAEQERIIMTELIQELDKHNIDQAKLLVKNKFKLTWNRTNYLWQKFNKDSKFSTVLNYLGGADYMMRTYKGAQEDIPQLMISTSNQMIRLFKNFGNVITFDITYNLIRRRSSENHQWGLGVFGGFGPNLEPLIFAFCIIARETKQSFIRLFQNLFQMLENPPDCIITDQQLAIKQALIDLKQARLFLGGHYHDIFHVLKNVKRKASRKALPYFKGLLKARNQAQYQKILLKLVDVQENQSVIKQFDTDKNMSCFSKLEKRFVGFSASTSRGQLINQLIKRKVPRQTNLLTLVRTIRPLFESLNKKSNSIKIESRKYELLFGDYYIKDVRVSVGYRVFREFIHSYVRGLRMETNKIDSDNYIVGNIQEKFRVSRVGTKWICPCNFTIKTGTPCQHLIKILWLTREFKYFEYLDSRWTNQQTINQERGQDELIFKIRGPGRPKNSRRNRIP